MADENGIYKKFLFWTVGIIATLVTALWGSNKIYFSDKINENKKCIVENKENILLVQEKSQLQGEQLISFKKDVESNTGEIETIKDRLEILDRMDRKLVKLLNEKGQ